MQRVPRHTARVVPVADDGTCLLLLEEDPARPGAPTWGTIGGAVDAGESTLEAAVRELREETALRVGVGELIGPVSERVHDYTWDAVAYVGRATVYALPLRRATAISFDHLQPAEIGSVLEARWLSPGGGRGGRPAGLARPA